MYYFLLILFLLIIIMIINCVIMRIYSMSAKAKYKKKQSCADKSIKIVKKKKSIFSVFILRSPIDKRSIKLKIRLVKYILHATKSNSS